MVGLGVTNSTESITRKTLTHMYEYISVLQYMYYTAQSRARLLLTTPGSLKEVELLLWPQLDVKLAPADGIDATILTRLLVICQKLR